MLLFYVFLLTSLNAFSLPDMNIKSMFFDLILKNNLKEFLKGFFGVKEDPECL
jgi:hypothetical protein